MAETFSSLPLAIKVRVHMLQLTKWPAGPQLLLSPDIL